MVDMRTAYRNRRRGTVAGPSVPVAFVMASFHVTVLVVLAVAGVYRSDALGDLLAGLSTPVGLGLFVYLWAVTWWTNRKVLERAPLEEVTSRAGAQALLVAGIVWGGATGVAFVLLPLIAVAIAVATGGNLGPAVFVIAIGAVVSAVVGGIVGVVAAGVDVGLVRLVDRLVTTGERR